MPTDDFVAPRVFLPKGVLQDGTRRRRTQGEGASPLHEYHHPSLPRDAGVSTP